jgi:hypothetical protein
MSRFSLFSASRRAGFCLLLAGTAFFPVTAKASSISGQDVNGKSIAVNGTGHYTLVLYTNPDLEDTSRKVSLALDSYRDRSNFTFVRVVDLRGGVPPNMRSIVCGQIRKELVKEDARLKKAGVEPNGHAPIIPDFSGSTLDALGWGSIYDDVHLVVYDTHGNEIKRLEKVSSASQVAKVVESIL